MKANRSRGARLLRKLPPSNREHLLTAGRQMARLARDYAVPIIFAPPLGVKGKISGATGFGVRLNSGIFIATAYHVLYDKGAYVDRVQKGQRVDCLIGNLPPLDPVSRVAWQDKELDVVFLRISEAEAEPSDHA